MALLPEFAELAPFQVIAQQHAQHGHHGDQQGQPVDIGIDLHFLRFLQGLDTAEHVYVQNGHDHAAADNRDAPERLHGRVHQAPGLAIEGLAVLVDPRYGFDGHRIGHDILQHVTDRRQQRAGHIPDLGRHYSPHRFGIGQQSQHDQQTDRDQRGTDEHQYRFEFPDQVDQVPQGHFQRPGYARPETKRRKELRRQPEIFFNEKRTDDAGKPGHARRHVNHQRRQIRKSHLATERQQVPVNPAI